jgi:hypothetical protein
LKLEEELAFDVLEAIHRRDCKASIIYCFNIYSRCFQQLEALNKPRDDLRFNQVANAYLDWKKTIKTIAS